MVITSHSCLTQCSTIWLTDSQGDWLVLLADRPWLTHCFWRLAGFSTQLPPLLSCITAPSLLADSLTLCTSALCSQLHFLSVGPKVDLCIGLHTDRRYASNGRQIKECTCLYVHANHAQPYETWFRWIQTKLIYTLETYISTQQETFPLNKINHLIISHYIWNFLICWFSPWIFVQNVTAACVVEIFQSRPTEQQTEIATTRAMLLARLKRKCLDFKLIRQILTSQEIVLFYFFYFTL